MEDQPPKERALPPLEPFLWRTRDGQRWLLPSEMTTTHLFYTIRMIWNHSCPPDLRVEHTHRYSFGPEYTPPYLQRAITHLVRELAKRDNLPQGLQSQYETIKNNWRAYLKGLIHNQDQESQNV